MSRLAKFGLVAVALIAAAYLVATRFNINLSHAVGEKLDEFNGVAVYYNGAINNTVGRATTGDGYNLGLKYQCVEFVKRYYYERFQHKMPNAMGNAKDFFAPAVADGELNKERGLIQYRNNAASAPVAEDLIVLAPWVFNRYGHVAIVSEVGPDFVEVIQQNAGPFGATRERFALTRANGVVRVENDRVLGWLRMPPPAPASAPTPGRGGLASPAS